MADAPDSKSGGGNPVGVQVPPPAPLDSESLKMDWKQFSRPASIRLAKGARSFRIASRTPSRTARRESC